MSNDPRVEPASSRVEVSRDLRVKPALSRVEVSRRPASCDVHGLYEQAVFVFGGFERVGGCPKCADIAAEREREERQRQEEGERVAARRAALATRLRDAAIPARFVDRSFANYAATTDDQRRARDICRHYATQFDRYLADGSSLTLMGTPGTGKTHLACAICIAVCGKHPAYFRTLSGMVRDVRRTWGGRGNEADVFDAYSGVTLLALDEVGTGGGSENANEILFDVLNARYASKLPTVVLTNLDEAGLLDFLGERMFDRLRDGGLVAEFNWPSHRGKC